MKKNKKKIVPYKFVSVQDDKTGKRHYVAFSSLFPINIDFYCKGQTDSLKVFDKNNHQGITLDENLSETYKIVNEIIREIKKKHPKAPIILVSHAGKNSVENILRHCDKGISGVINAHDHFNDITETSINGEKIPIYNLSQNGNIITSVKIHFDDRNGFRVNGKQFKTEPSIKNQQMENYYRRIFRKDLKPTMSVEADSKQPISVEGVRIKNHSIVNAITDAVLNRINDVLEANQMDKADIFMIRRSAFRANLPVGEKVLSNMDLKGLTSGLTESDGEIFVGQISGQIIADLIYQNILEHGDDEKTQFRNPILGFSGVRFSKSQVKNSKNAKEAAKSIEVK